MLDILIDLLTPVFVSMGASAADVANYVRAAGGYVYAILGILAAVVVVMVAAQFVVKKGARHVVRWTGALAGVLAIVLVVNLVCFGPMYAMVSGVLNASKAEISDDVVANSLAVVQETGEEGMVLLKNDGLLPLSSDVSALNVFGWASAHPVFSGTGSAASGDASIPQTDIITSLNEAGFATNEELTKMYADYGKDYWGGDRPVIKVFERDEKVMEELALPSDLKAHLEAHIADCEREMDDDAESIITNQRYAYINGVVSKAVRKKAAKHSLSVSDRIDQIVTNRILALPIFAAVMFLIYSIAMGTSPAGLFVGEEWGIGIGSWGTDWANDTFFGEIVPGFFDSVLTSLNVSGWLYGLIMDGIVAGVGAVLGFVPQMLVLFLLLAILEDCGYMARIAFIMDRIFRRFGLSGKSFIPMLVATGCGVPGIMASRTIEQDRDRKMTIMTTGFIPCGAKMPIIGLFAGAVFGGSSLVATSAFFIGIAAVVISGIMLKKFKAFAGEPAPFVMELPAYHAPSAGNVLRATWERGWSFIKRAGTVILLSTIVLWFLQGYGFTDGVFGPVEDNNTSLLAAIGNAIAWIFYPLGWRGDMAWKATVASFTGLIAKENVVGTMATLYHFAGEISENGEEIWTLVGADFGALTAYSFMIFNLLCAPCFAAMGAIKREMNNARWTAFAIGYMCVFAYAAALIVYQIGGLITGAASFSLWTVVALVLLVGILYLLLRKGYQGEESTRRLTSVAAAK